MRRRWFLFAVVGIRLVAGGGPCPTNATSRPLLSASEPQRRQLAAASHAAAVEVTQKRVPRSDLAIFASRQETQRLGDIVGRVIDARGQPVSHARVYALPLPPRMGLVPDAITGPNGRFRIKNLAVGKYQVSVEKEEARYPNTESRFSSAGFVKMPEVIVRAGQTVSCGDVQLGSKAGKLVGTLRDAKTKKGVISYTSPMQTRHVILCRLDDPKNCSDASPNRNGDFKILVPPVPFTIEATAPGYEKKDLGPLRLKRGEIRRFDILLTPTN